MAAIGHMAATQQVNQNWERAEMARLGRASSYIAQTQDQVSRMISDAYNNRSASWDRISRQRSNATLYATDVVDQRTGTQYKVEAGSNYYLIDPQGNIVGTQANTPPAWSFEQMLELGR